MPSRAFVPAPLTEAQPRVYKSFRGRQMKGLAIAAAAVTVVLMIFGASDVTGYALAFTAALPGFAYGYYQPQGKPVEYWLRVVFHYYTKPQMITACPTGRRPRWQLLVAQLVPKFARKARKRRTFKPAAENIHAAQVMPTTNRRRKEPTAVHQAESHPFTVAPGWAREENKTHG